MQKSVRKPHISKIGTTYPYLKKKKKKNKQQTKTKRGALPVHLVTPLNSIRSFLDAVS